MSPGVLPPSPWRPAPVPGQTGPQRQQPAPCQEPSGSDQPIGETVWRQPVDLSDDSLPARLVLPSMEEPINYTV